MELSIKDAATKAEELFRKLYSKRLAELDKNLIKREIINNEVMNVPVFVLEKGGGTLINTTDNDDMVRMNPPAEISSISKKVESLFIVYRFAISYSELEPLIKSEQTFKYAFDQIVEQMIANIESTVGSPDLVRFGKTYLTLTRVLGNDLESTIIFSFNHEATKCA
ncbi:MAG: hypothetical protein ACKOWO_08030 [Sediminibacterium sp.]